ncbi:MAG: hypothetical protein IH841_08310, partial [Thaumarchaeota archaeon]|nr:hypothetical protein [Nitrososphaerota archaeon]
ETDDGTIESVTDENASHHSESPVRESQSITQNVSPTPAPQGSINPIGASPTIFNPFASNVNQIVADTPSFHSIRPL